VTEASNDIPNLLGADLRETLARLDQVDQLERIEGAHWDLELGGITELMALRNGPALLFDRIADYPEGHRVVTNLLNNPARTAVLMGLDPSTHPLQTVRAIQKLYANPKHHKPVFVEQGTFAEVERFGDDVDLLSLPVPKFHELDGGRYLGTACSVIMKDPDSGVVNVGTYRMMVHDERTLGLVIRRAHHGSMIMRKYWERGEPAPVAAAIGTRTNVLFASFAGVPWGTSEYEWASGLTNEPVELVEGPVAGLPLPASAEIIIEGSVPPEDTRREVEGPFGEVFGYYASGAEEHAVIEVEAMYHREDPILLGSPPMRPPASSNATYMFYAANLWTELERIGVPEVRGVWMLPTGASSLLRVISIKQQYPGHAIQAGLAALSGRTGAGQIGRFIIVVDEDIDPSNQDEVLWAIATRCDPEADVQVIRHQVSSGLDPRLEPEKRRSGDMSSSRAIIDACRPYHWRNEFPPSTGVSREFAEKLLADWPQLFGAP